MVVNFHCDFLWYNKCPVSFYVINKCRPLFVNLDHLTKNVIGKLEFGNSSGRMWKGKMHYAKMQSLIVHSRRI